jgi:hypothetical protein
MTQDEIIEITRQLQICELTSKPKQSIHYSLTIHEMQEVAKLVAAKEREACAKVCEQITNDMSNWHSAYLGVTSETKFIRKTGEIVGQPFIEAIRARGQA